MGRERWDSETRKKSPYSWCRERHGWNAWAIQCAVFFESSWHVVGAVSTHQMRVDFWECLVVSGGREAWCWMQEAASKVSLEQGDLMPEPRPPSPTSAFAAFLLELSHTLSPSPRPCHPVTLPIWEFRHLECQRVCSHFPFVCHRVPLRGPPEPVFRELSEEEACC